MILRLHPAPAKTVPLPGLYLAEDLRARAGATGHFLYTDFITSLDGRISLPDPLTGRRAVPGAIANARDWRLYMELLAQADVLLTSERHLRAVAAGRHGNLLRLAQAEYPELVAWRRDQGLPPHPACAAISAKLDLPAEALRACHDGPIALVVPATAAPARIAELERAGVSVLRAGAGARITGGELVSALTGHGHHVIYSIAGPRVFHTLLAAGVIDRLYLTLALTLLGGEHYDTLTAGPLLHPPRGFALRSLHLDHRNEPNQLFACLERTPVTAA